MKIKTTLIAGIALFTVNSSAQGQSENVRAISWTEATPSVAEIVSVNPSDGSTTKLINRVDLGTGRAYIPNSLTYVKDDNSMYFFTQSANFNKDIRFGSFSAQQRLLLANASTGEVVREIPFLNSAFVAPFVISEEGQVGFVSTEQSHNGYGNNDENNSLVVFNINTGEVAHKIKLPSLSFGGVTAPFYGEIETGTINGFGTDGKTMISIGSPCYVSSSKRLLFAGRDVMGINRLFVFDLNNGTLVSQSQLSGNILDMVYDEESKLVKALYIKNLEGGNELRIGDLDLTSKSITNSTLVRELTSDEEVITDGSIELDEATGTLYVVKSKSDIQYVYTFTTDFTLVSEKQRSNQSKVDFEFKAPVSTSAADAFGNIVKVYPNPAVDEVTVETISLTKVTRIRVLNNLGQEVKDVVVQSEQLSNSINVSNLVTGMYMLEIHSDGAEVLFEKLIVE